MMYYFNVKLFLFFFIFFNKIFVFCCFLFFFDIIIYFLFGIIINMIKVEMNGKKSIDKKKINHKQNTSLLYLQINNQKIQNKKIRIKNFHFLPNHNINTYKNIQRNSSSSNVVLPSIRIFSQNTSQKNINNISFKNNHENILNSSEKINKRQNNLKKLKKKNQIFERNSLLKKNSFLLYSRLNLTKRNLKNLSIDNRFNNNISLESFKSDNNNYQCINNYKFNINNNKKNNSNSYLSIFDNQFQNFQNENNNSIKKRNTNLIKCDSFKQSNQIILKDLFKILTEKKFLKQTN